MAKVVFPVKIEEATRAKLRKKGAKMVKEKKTNSVNAMCEAVLTDYANSK